MIEKKYNINVSNTEEGNGYQDTVVLAGGQITESELEEFIQELAKYSAIPKTSCLYSFNFNFHNYMEKNICLRTDFPCFDKSKGLREKHSAGVHISIQLKSKHKCSTNNLFCDIRDVCFEHIRTGKCKDEFVINHIGKKLFADKYANQK